MRLSYDPRYNIAYLRFREKVPGVESIRVSDELIVDLAPDGAIYGIELLNANEQIHCDDLNGFQITNEVTGQEMEIPLPVS